MNEHLPVCVALQETLLKPSCTFNIRGYSILRKDCNTGEKACGGIICSSTTQHPSPRSDHFPVVISYAPPTACATLRQPRWKFDQADWGTFRTPADIIEDMVSSGSIDVAVSSVTSCILSAALIMQFQNHPLDSPVSPNLGGTKNAKWQKRIKTGLGIGFDVTLHQKT
ncbi:hypothetical protein TNIN_369871 [Trichonephila inaurata madagascariensis]|uniref:Uncharacterized protein n=1 Tax=Trichonephila inaurata madagascariensis TaxID=2747483 RepID=A0A8X6JEE4_9ARAC|nr:hypothetical protein TNIN_369871 [Trichonephila inaurata madagascariensis]